MKKTIYIGNAVGSKEFNGFLKQIKRFTKDSDSGNIRQALEFFLNALKENDRVIKRYKDDLKKGDDGEK